MATTRRILRSRVSVSTTEQETQRDDFPETHQLPRRRLRPRFTKSPPRVDSKEVQKLDVRKSPHLAKLLNPYSTVSTDSDWQEHSGSEPEEHVDESCEPAVVKRNDTQSPKNKEETETNKVNEENLGMVMDETPNQTNKRNDRAPESQLTNKFHELPRRQLRQRFAKSPPRVDIKEVQKLDVRKSPRLAKLLNPYSTVSFDSDWQEHGGSKPGAHADESCEPAVVKRNDTQSPKNKEKTETNKVNGENLGMVMDEGEVSRQSPRVTDGGPVPECESWSANATYNNERDSKSKSDAATGTDSKMSFSKKEIQAVIWKIVIGAEEQLKAKASETKLLRDASFRKTGSVASSRKTESVASPRGPGSVASPRVTGATATHRKSLEAVGKRTSLIKTWNLRSKNQTSDDALSNVEDENEAEPLTTSVGALEGMELKMQTIEKAEVKEEDKVIEEANEQVTEVPEEPSGETKENHVRKHKDTTQSGHHLIVSNLDSSKSFGELQVAIIRFFVRKRLSVTSIGIKKSRKCGRVTFLTKDDLNQALRNDGEELFGRALRLHRPEKIQGPLTAARGKKQMRMELDQGSVIRTKTKRVHKSFLFNTSKRCSACLIKKRISRVATTKKTRKNSASPITTKTMIQAEKRDEAATSTLPKKKKKETWEEEEKREDEKACVPPPQQKKRKLDEKVLLDERKDKAAGLEKKNKKKMEKAVLKVERGEEEGDPVPPPKKKKKKHQEKGSSAEDLFNEERDEVKTAAALPPMKKKKNVAVNGKREAVEEHAEPLKTEKVKHQNKTSWCLHLQKIGFQGNKSKMKTAIGNFLNESSLGYKKILLYPSRCSAYVELHCKEDLNKAFQLDTRKIFGQAVKLNKVEKLGTLKEGDCRTLCIKSLPGEVSAKNLKKQLEQVAGIWIRENPKNSKRSALVAFKTGEDADEALSKCDIECKGNPIRLQPVHQKSKEKRKILKVTNLCPLSKDFLKSLFTDAENVRIVEGNVGQSQEIAYVEYRTTKQAKAALKQFQGKGVEGQAIRVASTPEGEERPEKRLLQEEKKKRHERKNADTNRKRSPERPLHEKKKKRKRCKSDLSPPSNSSFAWNSPPKVKLDELRSPFKGSLGAKIRSSKRPCV